MRSAPMWISAMLAAGVVTIGLGIDIAGWRSAAIAQKRSGAVGRSHRELVARG